MYAAHTEDVLGYVAKHDIFKARALLFRSHMVLLFLFSKLIGNFTASESGCSKQVMHECQQQIRLVKEQGPFRCQNRWTSSISMHSCLARACGNINVHRTAEER